VLTLDAATGETVAEYGDARDPRELLVEGGLLIVSDAKSIRAFDPASRKMVWEAAIEARRLVVEGDNILILTGTQVIGLDRASGRERWKKEDPDAALALTCTAHKGYLVLEKSTLRDDPVGCGIKVYGTKDGELLWTRDYKPDMTHYREARAYFAQDLLWLPAEKEGLLGLDPKTGSERKHGSPRESIAPRRWPRSASSSRPSASSPTSPTERRPAPGCSRAPADSPSSRRTGCSTPSPCSASAFRCCAARWGSPREALRDRRGSAPGEGRARVRARGPAEARRPGGRMAGLPP